jgi:hypothetical protein
MNEKIEGTLLLDGMIEGKLPRFPDAEQRIRDWAERPFSAKFRFSADVQGSRFSLMPDTTPLSAAPFGRDAALGIAESVEQLLKIFPPEERGGVFSTLRSVEYQKNQEIQTFYAIAPNGTVATRQRSADATTTAPPQPLSARQRLRMAATSGVVLLAVFGLSTLFVDYRRLFADIRDQVVAPDPAAIQIEHPAYDRYIRVTDKKLGQGGKTLLVTLARTESFPVNDPSSQPSVTPPGATIGERLALDAMARGYVRCEYFDSEGAFVGFSLERIAGLRTQETITLELPLGATARHRAGRIVITY